MFGRKLRLRNQFLEERVKKLVEENQQLRVVANDARLHAESLRKAVKMYQKYVPERDEKGRFVKKEI